MGISPEKLAALYPLNGFSLRCVPPHPGGRNTVYICSKDGADSFVLRVSSLGDRILPSYLAETEFVRYLAQNGAPVADVLPSVNGSYVECIESEGITHFVSLFEYADGMLISENGYRYREGAPLSEYFYNTGKTLGIIHRLSKEYKPRFRRPDFSERYNPDYLKALIPDEYSGLKSAILNRIEKYSRLPSNESCCGLVHFDFNDGNYHINMDTGKITVFDFDNCLYCHYMFDLAALWIQGTGWCAFERDADKRRHFMKEYFDTVVRGYRSETDLSDGQLELLPFFIDLALVESIVDEFECCRRSGELPDYDDITDTSASLIGNIPYAGFFQVSR